MFEVTQSVQLIKLKGIRSKATKTLWVCQVQDVIPVHLKYKTNLLELKTYRYKVTKYTNNFAQ